MEYGRLSELAQRVITGKATIARLDKDEEQGRIAGGCRNVEATIVLGTAIEHHQSQQQGGGCAVNKEAAKQKAILKAYSDELLKNGINIWYSEVEIEEIKKLPLVMFWQVPTNIYILLTPMCR